MSKESEKVLEILVNFANAIEAASVDLKQRVGELVGVKESVAVKEETFTCLKFEKQQGAKIGEYETAYKPQNIPEKFQSAFNILSKNNATISNRYDGEDYVYSYWLYGKDKIYRQKRKRT